MTHFFDDELVPGTEGVRHGPAGEIEPFPTQDLVPYDTAFLSGFVVEHYQVVLLDAAERAVQQMDEQARGACAPQQVPGDTYRNLQISPTYSDRTFKHVLVPVWLLTYNFGTRTFQVLVNGYTGKMDGTYPISPWKVIGLILIALLLVLSFLYLEGG